MTLQKRKLKVNVAYKKAAAVARYSKACGMSSCSTLDDLRILYTEAASQTGLLRCLQRENKLFTTNVFGGAEIQLNYSLDALPSNVYSVGDPSRTTFGVGYVSLPMTPLSRGKLVQAIYSRFGKGTGPLIQEGTWASPSFIRPSALLQRTASPSTGAHILDGIPFKSLQKSGGLLQDGWAEVTNATGPVGTPLLLRDFGINSFRRSEQHLWLYDAKGGGVGVQCDIKRTLVGLNKSDCSIRWLMQRYSITRAEAIALYVKTSGITNTTQLDVTQFSINLAHHVDERDWTKGTNLYVISGLYAPPNKKPMWQLACEHGNIRSISNPTAPYSAYGAADIAEVFVQACTIPNWMVRVSHPFAKLAALQNFELSSVNDLLNADIIGRVGSPREDYPYDLVQALFEYHGQCFSCEMTYAWWRFIKYQDSSLNTQLLFPKNYVPTPDSIQTLPTVDELPTGLQKLIVSSTGPFAVKQLHGDKISWSNSATINYFTSGLQPLLFGFTSNAVPTLGYSKHQMNTNYLAYTLQQMRFGPSPLCALNPTGGTLQYLGTYNAFTGQMIDPFDVAFGGSVAADYGFAPLSRLPKGGPGTVYPPGKPQTIKVFHQFWYVIAGGNPYVAGDTSAPNVIVPAGAWLLYDNQAGAYVYTSPWPFNAIGIPGGVDIITALPPLFTSALATVLATTTWDHSVRPSINAASIDGLAVLSNW